MTDKPVKLRSKQKRAIKALLEYRTIAAAADAASVSERTIYRWFDVPAFRAALNKAEGQAIDAATRNLLTLSKAAINVFYEVMQDENISPGVRLRAADRVMDHLVRLRELRDVEQRLATLEAKVYGTNEKTIG